MKHFSSAARMTALLSLAISVVGCAGDDYTLSADSALGASRLGSPAQANMSNVDKDDRGANEAAIIAFQQSDEWKASGRRCGSDNVLPEPEAFAASDCSYTSTTIKDEYAPENGSEIVIPVVFHVIVTSDGSEGNIPMALLTSQIEVLNEDFNAAAGSLGAGGVNGKIRFVLATTKPDGSATTGIEYVSNDNFFKDPGSGLSPMKKALNWDTTRYFNIYTNDANGALGYATFPSQTAGKEDDGVVLLWTSVGRNAPDGGIYNLGRTATHEVGHYLGLFHTFHGSSCSESTYNNGDLIRETPQQRQPQFDCPTGTAAQSCSGITAATWNYMNYTQDSCMTGFSPEQVNRMRCSILAYRPGFVTANPPPPSNDEPQARFVTASVHTLSVTFTDGSTDSDGTIVAWDWTFGDGATSHEQHPTHTYAQPGTYAVSLTVMDDQSATATYTGSVTVSAGGSDNTLQNGKAVTGLSGGKDEELFYTLAVGEGAKDLRFALSDGSGDADLFVRFGDRPTLSTYDYRTKTKGNHDVVLPKVAKAGTWYVMVRGYKAFSNATLTASYSSGGDARASITSDTNNGAIAGRQALRYEVAVSGGRIDARLAWTGAFDLDLFITDDKDNELASASTATENPETLSYDTKGKAGTYRIYVYNYSSTTAAASYTLSATWQK